MDNAEFLFDNVGGSGEGNKELSGLTWTFSLTGLTEPGTVEPNA